MHLSLAFKIRKTVLFGRNSTKSEKSPYFSLLSHFSQSKILQLSEKYKEIGLRGDGIPKDTPGPPCDRGSPHRQRRRPTDMLEKSRLNPPRDLHPAVATHTASSAPMVSDRLFVSAEDFDGTGILAGIDPCASSYWWMPELYGPEASLDVATMPTAVSESNRLSADGPFDSLRSDRDQATRRTASRTTAAA